jgi:hypothetical protein
MMLVMRYNDKYNTKLSDRTEMYSKRLNYTKLQKGQKICIIGSGKKRSGEIITYGELKEEPSIITLSANNKSRLKNCNTNGNFTYFKITILVNNINIHLLSKDPILKIVSPRLLKEYDSERLQLLLYPTITKVD